MYKTADECYKKQMKQVTNYSYYQGPSGAHTKDAHKIYTTDNKRPVPVEKEYIADNKRPVPVEKESKQKGSQGPLKIHWKTSHHTNMSDPKVWGPAFWFTLHNGASKYAISASPVIRERLKSFILGIPIMLPCSVCRIHANNLIDDNKHNLDEICSGRDKLFKFFVDFHNIVNKRYNKPIVSVEEAKSIYNGGVSLNVMTMT